MVIWKPNKYNIIVEFHSEDGNRDSIKESLSSPHTEVMCLLSPLFSVMEKC